MNSRASGIGHVGTPARFVPTRKTVSQRLATCPECGAAPGEACKDGAWPEHICPACGYARDTPNHEYGCRESR